jgi:hypothetical protein
MLYGLPSTHGRPRGYPGTFLSGFVIAVLLALPAFAQEKSTSELNKALTNPVSEIWSITFQQNNFRVDPGPGVGNRWSSNLLFQPVLPVGISEDWNLITRPVVPLFVSTPFPDPEPGHPASLSRTTAFGDVTLLQLVSPSPKLAGDWLLGFGPSWIFPTASSKYTGQNKYQVGPAALVGYLSEKWILGGLVQNWWSFSGSDRVPSTAQMNLPPRPPRIRRSRGAPGTPRSAASGTSTRPTRCRPAAAGSVGRCASRGPGG